MNRQKWFQENQCSINDFVTTDNYSQALDRLKEMQRDFKVLAERLGIALANARVIGRSEGDYFCIDFDGEVTIPVHYLAKFCPKDAGYQAVAEPILSELKQQIQKQEVYAKAALGEMVE